MELRKINTSDYEAQWAYTTELPAESVSDIISDDCYYRTYFGCWEKRMIRKAMTDDISRIAEILVFVKRMKFRPIFQNDDYSFGELQVLRVAKQYKSPDILDNIWVYDDGIVKGLIHIESNEIVELYVDYFFQNQGVGAALIEYAKANFPVTFLWAIEKNVDAIRFYERHGFHVTNKKKFEEGTTEYLVMLERTLPEHKVGLRRGTVLVEPHSSEWETIAAETIAKLQNILQNVLIDAQHIGSTAIRDICAKPIIDIVAGVSDFDELLSKNSILEENGFIFRGQDHPGQYLYVCGDNEFRTHHIHAVIYHSEAWNNYVNMRDYLNCHKEDAEAYSKLKASLAKQYSDDRATYTAMKSELISEILTKAKKWREGQKA